MEKVYKDCQSCGMPLKKDAQGGGSHADGSISTVYCSHCYQRGVFTMPDCTIEQMQDNVKDKMKAMGFPGFLATLYVRKLLE